MDKVVRFHESNSCKLFALLLLLKFCQCQASDVEALLAFRKQLESGAPVGWVGNNPCQWTGVACGQAKEVVGIALPQMNLTATLDFGIGQLTSLVTLNLSRNSFYGPIPTDLQNCQSLETLDISKNNFEGKFSIVFTLKNLVFLNLAGNSLLTDRIPASVETLSNLRVMNLSTIGLVGAIPPEIGNCSNLVSLDASGCGLAGSVPSSLFSLPELKEIVLSRNSLSGDLESVTAASVSSLEMLLLDDNDLIGKVPQLFTNLSNLIVLQASKNLFTGFLPLELSNLTRLVILDLSSNLLSGSIPSALGRLSALTVLSLSWNYLIGVIPGELFWSQSLESLSLDHNQLGHYLPREIGNLTFLENVELQENSLIGSIPSELAQCKSLKQINLSHNRIGGQLPKELASLSNLTRLLLAGNRLTGKIPPELFTMPGIEYIVLSQNLLEGPIPDTFIDGSELLNLELADNLLTGSLPRTLSLPLKLQMLDLSKNGLVGDLSEVTVGMNSSQLQFLRLSENNFSGSMDLWMDRMKGLLILDLHGNRLEGAIPATVGELFQVGFVDLSHNQIRGSIPAELYHCSFLTVLNLSSNDLIGGLPFEFGTAWPSNITVDLSDNHLSGTIPSTYSSNMKLNVSNNQLEGPIPASLWNMSASAFSNNPRLCGLPLATNCVVQQPSSSEHISLGKLLVIMSGCVLALIIASLIICRWIRKSHAAVLSHRKALSHHVLSEDETPVTWLSSSWQTETGVHSTPDKKQYVLTYNDLLQATGNFSEDNVLGGGGFGKVYRGHLKDGTIVAIKKLTGNGIQGEREFVAEMETLGSLNHKNLVPLLGHCISGMERLLVYEYMPNNSLDNWLHTRTDGMEPLSWPTRRSIAKDVARGLTFLHHFCIPHVIHRDLKSSNILLDEKFCAHLADFGLARYISTYESHIITEVAGSLGYIAPEYGQSWRITTRGDVFSFGVVLLEILSGRRPAGGIYTPVQGGNLVSWIRHMKENGSALDVFDTIMSVTGFESELTAALQIAIDCVQDVPSKRPSMLEVLRRLEDKC